MSTHGCGHSDDQGCLREVKLAMDGAEETIEASLARWEVLFKALPDLRADIAARMSPHSTPVCEMTWRRRCKSSGTQGTSLNRSCGGRYNLRPVK